MTEERKVTLPTCFGVRSEFSLGESSLSVKDIFAQAAECGYGQVALTDTMTISSLIEAAKESKKAGIPLIAGCRLRVQSCLHEVPHFYYPKVYIRNDQGLRDLMKALSEAETFKLDRFVSHKSLCELLSKDNVVVSLGDEFSLLSSVFSDFDALAHLRDLKDAKRSSQTLFAELVAIDTPHFIRQNLRVFDLANDLPKIISQPVLYKTEEDADARDALHTIIRRQKATSRFRNIPHARHLHFRPSYEFTRTIIGQVMRSKDVFAWPSDLPDQIKAARESNLDLTNACIGYEWHPEEICLPKLAHDEFALLAELCREGFRERIRNSVLGYKPPDHLLPEYKDRMIGELKVLRDLGFAGYFLVVRDLVMWAKDNGIIVGPGRGSVGGSLVAYLLGITDVDPIRFGLLFERFINPDRIDLPDADLDFMSTRRQEVIEYLKDKYGDECVAGISNYNSMASASSVREIGRIHELKASDYACSKYIPKPHGKPMPLIDAVEEVAELEKFATAFPELWRLALGIEGKMRGLGQHAAGIVVAGEPVVNRAVVERRKDENVVCWDKRVVEEMGLVKIDILGLSTLDILKHTLDKIQERHGKEIDLLDLPLDDEKTLQAFAAGNTVGVFQFESGGMQKLLRDIASGGPLTFEDLSAATALYRPGPMDSGLLDDYVAIRKGAAMEHYEHPSMEPALKETNGVMVYQEQAMQIARDFAGFTLAESDHLRKAIGKKDKDKMAKLRDKFVDGAIATSGVAKILADRIWNQIEAFGGYGFNKSHSVEYSLISYWQMWLKVYYPVEFFAASLELHKEERLMGIVRDAEANGIELLPPDINKSTDQFEIYSDKLLIPFNRVKGISDNTTRAILEAREKVGGEFKTVDDLVDNVQRRLCNVRHRDHLERVGAFASITPGAKPVTHPDRLKDQLELIPGLITRSVVADRKLNRDKDTREALGQIILECRKKNGGIQPTPRLGRNPKFMVVFDCPTSDEERAGKMMEGLSADFVRHAFLTAGLSLNDAYFTTLCKTPKSGKQLSNDEINNHKPYLDREIELLNPAVIVTLGSAVSRAICPDEKGGILDLAGKVVFNADLDSSIVIGINPMMIFFDSSKQDILDDVFKKVVDLVE